MKQEQLCQLEMQYCEGRHQIKFAFLKMETVEQNTLYETQIEQGYNNEGLFHGTLLQKDSIIKAIFTPEEAALVVARNMFLAFSKNSPERSKAIETEWKSILSPSYDCSWFMGGMTEQEWEMAFRDKMQKMIAE